MPIENVELIHTAEERELGMKLLDKYKHASYKLDQEYYSRLPELEKIRLKEGHEAYMKARKPHWEAYQKADKELYDHFVEGAEALGYRLKAI